MPQNAARKTGGPGKAKDAHILNLPLASGQADRDPRNHERWLIATLMRMAGSPPVAFRLWNGDLIEPEDQAARYTLHLNDPKALYALVTNPTLAFGDLYAAGRLEVEGDLPELMETLYHSVHEARRKWPRWLDSFWRSHNPRPTGIPESRDNIHHHYDLGNDFYALWLDQAAMQYTCAYYETPALNLEQAQLAKLEHTCRKLRLKPGMTVVEAGCGWGGLALYMARNYGVRVYAYNISAAQLEWARAESKQQGLDGLVTFIEDDYRNIQGQYDAFVSVGMLEHVGRENYPAFAELIRNTLKPGGLALLHSIGRNRPTPVNAWIEKRIFPGAYPPSISELMEICEQGDFSVLDVENLRLHYARTLRHWLDRFDASADRITDMYDEHFTRAWRLYLAGSISAFMAGSLQLFQVVFSHCDNHLVPLTRQDLYTFPSKPEGV